MHRTEGTNHKLNMFEDGPPGTRVEEDWLNAVQEEIAHVIEDAAITLKTASTDTRDQLLMAILTYVNLARFFWTTEIKTADYVVTTADNGKLLLVDAALGDVTLALPAPVVALNGFVIGVKKTDASANKIKIDPAGAAQIEGANDFYLRLLNGTAIVVCNGVEYFLIALNEITGDMCAAALKDPAAAIAGLRTLGSGANQAMPGDEIPADAVVKAWIQFDGTGVVVIKDSYNVSSIVDNAVGDYYVYWDTDFADVNYCTVGMAGNLTVSDQLAVVQSYSIEAARIRVNTRLQHREDPTVNYDFDKISLMAIGDQ